MFDVIARAIDWTQIVIFFLTCLGAGIAFFYRNVFREWVRVAVEVVDSLKKIPALEKRVESIYYYVSPNGGGSIIDTVKRVETAVTRVQSDLSLLSDTLRVQNDTDEVTGRFHTSDEGDNVYVNQTYARMLRVGKAELMGWNFLNFIHPEDVKKVKMHWDQCREERRQYRMQHRMVTSEGDHIEVSVIATPIPDSGEPKMWVGTVRRVDAAAHSAGCPLGIRDRNNGKA